MSHWTFVIAAYAFALVLVAGLVLQSFLAMRAAEAEAEKLPDRR